MALTIVQSPVEVLNAAYTKLPYVISGSTNISQPQHEYVLDIFESGSTEIIARMTQVINPEQAAVFEPSKIFQGQLSPDPSWKIVTNSGSLSSQKTFELKFTEQYGTSPSSSVTIQPYQATTSISVISAVVNPYPDPYYEYYAQTYPQPFPSFNLTEVDPRIVEDAKFQNQLSDNPYYFEYESHPYYYNSYRAHCPVGPDDYETVDLALAVTGSFVALEPAVPHNVRVIVNDENGSNLFVGYPYISGSNIAPFLSGNARPLYTGSIEGVQWRIGQGPANLRDVRMHSFYTGSLGDKTFGEVIDSGSWLRYEVQAQAYGSPTNARTDLNFFVNQAKIKQLIQDFPLVNTNIPYAQNIGCGESTRFAFINEYGAWDYYTNWNPVRRSSNVVRDNVTLPEINYSGINTTFESTRRGETNYFTNVTDTYVTDTPPIDQWFALWLEQMLESPSVYIQQNGDFIPIVITNASYQHNNSTARNKQFIYTIEFQPAKGRQLYF